MLTVGDGWPTLVGVFRFCGTEEREEILNNNTIKLLQCGLVAIAIITLETNQVPLESPH